jgi:hypothetical protein
LATLVAAFAWFAFPWWEKRHNNEGNSDPVPWEGTLKVESTGAVTLSGKDLDSKVIHTVLAQADRRIVQPAPGMWDGNAIHKDRLDPFFSLVRPVVVSDLGAAFLKAGGADGAFEVAGVRYRTGDFSGGASASFDTEHYWVSTDPPDANVWTVDAAYKTQTATWYVSKKKQTTPVIPSPGP